MITQMSTCENKTLLLTVFQDNSSNVLAICNVRAVTPSNKSSAPFPREAFKSHSQLVHLRLLRLGPIM